MRTSVTPQGHCPGQFYLLCSQARSWQGRPFPTQLSPPRRGLPGPPPPPAMVAPLPALSRLPRAPSSAPALYPGSPPQEQSPDWWSRIPQVCTRWPVTSTLSLPSHQELAALGGEGGEAGGTLGMLSLNHWTTREVPPPLLDYRK